MTVLTGLGREWKLAALGDLVFGRLSECCNAEP
jgi:hypothetical protein